MHKFSIIIPHKDCPELLTRCLASIEMRDDVQVIVVDDNSAEAPVVDPRVQLILDKSGKGAGHARNIGLEHADGEWLIFADADDFFVEGMYSVAAASVDDSSDIVFLAPVELNEDLTAYDGPSKLNWYFSHFEPEAKEFMFRYMASEPWCKIIRRSMVAGIRFDETMVANDWGFAVRAGHQAARVKWINRPFYCYIHRSQSLSHGIADDKRQIERIRVYAGVCQFMHGHGLPWSDVVLYRKLMALTGRPAMLCKALKAISFYKPVPKMLGSLAAWRLTRRRKDLENYYHQCPL